jgi:dTDP-4-amino-4,6-dideoxygalactose transaminase
MSGNTKIPFLDLVTPHTELREDLCEVFEKALATAGFIGGPMVQDFERDFAGYCTTSYCVGVSSGTDAIRFALIAVGVTPGDAVITVPNTFIATTEAISQAGARPVFIDIDEATYNIDPQKLRTYIESECTVDGRTGQLIEKKSGRRLAAIVPVYLYGQPADMDAILEIAEEHRLPVIEDACQAHGAEYFSRKENRWRPAGCMGRAAAFSFYPGKNLGACGEAGAVTTNDAELAQTIRLLRDHGQTQKYYHDVEGYNGRLDSIQAGILRAKLPHLSEWNAKRRELAAHYTALLADLKGEIILPYEPSWTRAVYHLYVVRVQNRDELMKHLGSMGIGTGIHYPIPLHLQKAYRSLGYRCGDFPVAEKVAPEILSLPMFPQLQRSQQEQVASEMMNFLLAEPSLRVPAARR